MELTLSAYLDEARTQLCVLDVEPSVPGREVVAALATHLGVAAQGLDAWNVRTKGRIAPDEPISAAMLLSGDHLLLASAEAPPRWGAHHPTMVPPPYVLSVVGGPASGERFDLTYGVNLLGRTGECTLVVPDPEVSRRHLSLTVVEGGVILEDLGSSAGTVVDGYRLTEAVTLLPGQIVTAGATIFTVEPQQHDLRVARVVPRDGALGFNRPPRVQVGVPEPPIELPTPPVKPHRRSLPLASALVPLLMGVAMAFFLGPYMLLFAVFSPVMAGISLFEERRGGHKEFRKTSYQFEVDLAHATNNLYAVHDDLVAARRAAAPDAVRLLDRARLHLPELWERRPSHTDFMTVRVGTADLPTTIEFSGGENPLAPDDLVAKVERLRLEHEVDRAVPVEIDLRGIGVLGSAGPAEPVASLARWLVVQAATLDSPRDLAIVVLCDPAEAWRWGWTSLLPHTRTLMPGLPGGRTIASAPDDAVALLRAIEDIVNERQAERNKRIGVDVETVGTTVLLVVAGEVGVSRSLLSKVLSEGPAVGVLAVCTSPNREGLPGECEVIIQASELYSDATLTRTSSGEVIQQIVLEGIALGAADTAARSLAPVIDITSSEGGGELPRRVLLLDALDLPDPSAAAVRARWDAAAPGSLRAPVGASGDGPLELDLRVDGPHGLVAGTTGAGKSELLQTLVAALAASHPTERLTFVLVDYKGGAAFKDCVQLPHTVGFFTDLDEHLAQRALISLNAELRRRERILRETGARDLLELEKLRQTGQVTQDIPANLLIVIDEFAFLKNEVPEFVVGVVDIAQRGRSLGVHLLLATQRPTGVIDDNIRANTNLRIALRVADENDSSDVIDRPDAARIPKSLPGRGYLRTGHEEAREIQVAFGGAASAGAAGSGEVRVMDLDFSSGLLGRRTTVHTMVGQQATVSASTDLQRVVDAVREAHVSLNPVEPVRPWLPPLGGLYSLGDLTAGVTPVLPPEASELATVLGVIDEPDHQRQSRWMVDLGANGHLLIYGAAGTGKTTTLRTLAVSLASRLWPSDLHLYGLDMASRGLRSIEALPHCGGVVYADEPERIERLLAMLEGMIVARAAAFGQVGSASLHEHRAAGHRDLPYVVVLLDGYHGFHSMFESLDHGAAIERLGRIAADGRSLGILLAVTVDRRSGLPSSLVGVASQRLILRMASDDEYAWLGVAAEARGAKLGPGRGFGDGTREVQVAVVGTEPAGVGQAQAVGDYAAHLASYGVEAHVPPIQLLPEHVSRQQLLHVNGTALAGLPGLDRVPLGIGGAAQGVLGVDLLDNPTFLVTGPDRSGRTTALAALAQGVVEGTPELTGAFLLAPRRSRLAELPGWTEVASGVDACEELAERLSDDVRARAGLGDRRPWLIVVDDGDELSEGRAALALETILRRGRDAGVILLTGALAHALHRMFGGWLVDARKSKHGLLLSPDLDLDGELFGVRLPRSGTRTFPVGRGFLIQRGPVEVVQVAE